MNQTLLVELQTEELPPKALMRLATSFANSISASLKDDVFLQNDSKTKAYATPRRLAVSITNVLAKSPDRPIRQKLLPVSIGRDKDGNATPPLKKKLATLKLDNVDISTLEIAQDGKNECFFYNYTAPGINLSTALQKAIEKAAGALPIPKVMTYQRPDGQTVSFVRPVHKLIALLGSDIIPVTLLGLNASNKTMGHRFLSPGEITIDSANSYEETLLSQGKVIADFTTRKEQIKSELLKKANGDNVLMPDALLDEVTALVEWPVIYECHFEESFLQVPQECLILTMQTNQKYFALTNDKGQLRSRFLIVSNLATDNPQHIIHGNERVVRPRLADAQFFFEQDKKKTLESRLPGLEQVVYHNKLGTLAQRTKRISQLATYIAQTLSVPTDLVIRAAQLAKADLLTEMVGEFPELQGIMGTYYARHDKENNDVAQACLEHYQPRFAGDVLPQTQTGTVLALADKLETIVGIWGIGLSPTGDRDPFALRRHALGILRILIEKQLPLSLSALLNNALQCFSEIDQFKDPTNEVLAFIIERARGLLREQGYSAYEVESVLTNIDQFDDIIKRLDAVRSFAELPEAASLAGANKRITNILKKSSVDASRVSPELFVEAAEKTLYEQMQKIGPNANAFFAAGDFTNTLKTLSQLHDPVDAFFADVMVMAEDVSLKNNRLALLKELHVLMNQVADISKLAT